MMKPNPWKLTWNIITHDSQLGRPVHVEKHSFEVEEKVSFEILWRLPDKDWRTGKKKNTEGLELDFKKKDFQIELKNWEEEKYQIVELGMGTIKLAVWTTVTVPHLFRNHQQQ